MSVRAAAPLTAVDIVGLLAEADRRRSFAALALGAADVPQVAAATGLTVHRAAAALQRMVAGGLVASDETTRRYELIDEVFSSAMRVERRVSAPRADGAGTYFRRGRLLSIPEHVLVRARVLGIVIEAFDPSRRYTEAAVNALCAEWNDDWVSLRRALVDSGLLVRDPSGTRYHRAQERAV